jgi:hypothetical protein
MNIPLRCLCLVTGVLSATFPLSAQTTWTNGGDDSSWQNSSNWSLGVPTSTSIVTIGVPATDASIGLDAGAPITVASLIFAGTLDESIEIVNVTAGDNLTVTGTVANQSSAQQHINTAFFAGGDALYSGGLGLEFSSLTVGLFDIATTGSISITSDLVFSIDSINLYGSIGAVSVAGTTTIAINLTPNYTPQVGDSFDFTTGSFAGAVLGPLPSLPNGYGWDSSQFLSQGVLLVTVPEPSTTCMLVAGGLMVLLIFRRRSTPQAARVPVVAKIQALAE